MQFFSEINWKKNENNYILLYYAAYIPSNLCCINIKQWNGKNNSITNLIGETGLFETG